MLKQIILIAGTCVAFSSAAFAQSSNNAQAPSKKTDWAQFYRYEQANSLPESQKPNVVFMGNSITDFWINSDPAFFTANGYLDRGISGQTSSEMLVRFRRDVIDLHPRIVVILAGTNDVAENNGKIDLNNVLGNIQSMCELALVNGIEPVLCSVLPCNNFFWRKEMKPAQKIKELNAMIHEFADRSEIAYVDYYTPMATAEGELRPELTKDGCHPNDMGYKVMEEVVKGIIEQALRR